MHELLDGLVRLVPVVGRLLVLVVLVVVLVAVVQTTVQPRPPLVRVVVVVGAELGDVLLELEREGADRGARREGGGGGRSGLVELWQGSGVSTQPFTVS